MQVGQACTIVRETSLPGEPHPAATWYDDGLRHFVALLERRANVSSSMSEQVEYRILSLKDNNIEAGPTLQFRLPISLAAEEHYAERIVCRRIPLLARQSLDGQLLAIQVTPKLLRIVELPSQDDDDNNHDKHWTIDLSLGRDPMSSSDDAVPVPRYRVQDANANKDETILPGGIIWSEHGGNSHDLVVVTTRSVLCYKISRKRKQMAATHFFHHPPACAMWWEPTTRTIVIGSYGPDPTRGMVLHLRTFLLRFPRPKATRLPRLELPPPHRLEPFCVANRTSPNELKLVNMYGCAHMVEAGLEDSTSFRLCFYRLERLLGAKLVKNCLIRDFQPSQRDVETMLMTVIDDALSVSFLESRKTIWIDVADRTSFYLIEELAFGDSEFDHNSNLSCILPSHILHPRGRGMVAPLSLDIHKLSAMVPPDHVSAPFFLGRSSPKAHGIALSKFASSLNIESGRQRRVWIEAIASIYCRDAGAVIWDWKATAPLIFKCGMLPPGSELRYHAIDTGGSFRLEAESNAPNKSSLLHQKEILEDVLLPTANESIQSSDASTLSRVLAIAVGLFGALERRDCPPCPALECFIVALLWRLGRDQELMAMLESRASAGRQSSRPCVGDFYNRNRTLVDHGTMILAKMIVAITNEVTFGASSRMHIRRSDACRLRRLVQTQATRILMSRSSVTNASIDYLLLQGRILDAMNICSTMTTTMTTSGVSDRSSYPVQAMAGSFLRAALVKAREETDPVEICRLFYTLHSFLSSWTKTFQLEPSSRTNRKHYYDQQREHVSFNNGDKANQSFSVRASTIPKQVQIHRQVSSQDLLVSTPRQGLLHDRTLHQASLFLEELEAVFKRTNNGGLGQQVRQLFEFRQITRKA